MLAMQERERERARPGQGQGQGQEEWERERESQRESTPSPILAGEQPMPAAPGKKQDKAKSMTPVSPLLCVHMLALLLTVTVTMCTCVWAGCSLPSVPPSDEPVQHDSVERPLCLRRSCCGGAATHPD